MGLLNHVYAHAVMPLFKNEGYRGYRRHWVEFAKREKLTADEDQRRQWADLTELLTHAYRSTEFYRRRFDEAGIRPEDIKTPDDLAKVPPLTREDIRQHVAGLCSSEYPKTELLGSATGGTTDVPVPFFRDRASLAKKTAAQARLNAWAGMYPGDKIFYLWGAQSDFAQNPSWRWRVYDRHVMRRIWAPTSLLNEETLESHRQRLNEFRPDVVYAYPTPLHLFCEYVKSSGRSLYRPKAAICTAEPLLDEHRAVIQEVLRCPVFEHYGSREFGMIAGECEAHEGLHFCSCSAFVEFVPLPGESGLHELVVTDLLNRGMPLIRYRSNDCAEPVSKICSCGRAYLIGTRQITGRVADNIILANGSVVPGVSLTNRVVQACPALRQIQIIQEEVRRFRLRYVPNETFADSDLVEMRQKLDRFIPPPTHWEFEAVRQIDRERSGKTRFCISRVARSPLAKLKVSSTVESEYQIQP